MGCHTWFYRKILSQQKFTKKEDRPFDAFYQAVAYLSDSGYTYGSLAVTSSLNVAVRKGKYDLPEKWHNLDKDDIESIDGVIRSLDYREGSVTVMLFNGSWLCLVAENTRPTLN